MRNGAKWTLAVISALLCVCYIFVIRTVDVAAIGPMGTEVGLSTLNGMVSALIGTRDLWYRVTEMLGYLAILLAGVFGVCGLIQWIRRKKLSRVDREIFLLAGLYIAVIALYVLFEKFPVNYRPILMDGETEPEASFPSSHTMLSIVVFGSAIPMVKKYLPSGWAGAASAVLWILLAVTVIGRLLSGVHWLTDILGGILIGTALLAFFMAALDTGTDSSRKGEYR